MYILYWAEHVEEWRKNCCFLAGAYNSENATSSVVTFGYNDDEAANKFDMGDIFIMCLSNLPFLLTDSPHCNNWTTIVFEGLRV